MGGSDSACPDVCDCKGGEKSEWRTDNAARECGIGEASGQGWKMWDEGRGGVRQAEGSPSAWLDEMKSNANTNMDTNTNTNTNMNTRTSTVTMHLSRGFPALSSKCTSRRGGALCRIYLSLASLLLARHAVCDRANAAVLPRKRDAGVKMGVRATSTKP